MKIQLLGAAKTVTGSCYLVEANNRRFAVDCGLHQGNAEIEKRNQNTRRYRAASLEFILLTHAHIDHSGLLPRMIKEGFRGPIYCTRPTRDLAEIMLLDSAHIQESEAAWQSRKNARQGKKPVEPLYTKDDALEAVKYFQTIEYNKPFSPTEGVTVTYRDAGHILGSSFVSLKVAEKDRLTRIVFSGDLGRPDTLMLDDPGHPGVTPDYLFLESTYGDRDHKDENRTRQELAEAITYSYTQGEKTIIPAFAVERTQEILYCLFLLQREGRIPENLPVYVDSPLAIRATEIFRKSAAFMDEEYKAFLARGEDPLSPANLKYTLETRESQALNTMPGPGVIISASGMCNAGRIKHHLRHNIWRPGAGIVFVGYQAIGTPGRKIVDGAQKITLMGEELSVAARIFTINGFSAHAGQSQLLDWVSKFTGQQLKIFLTHGEEAAQKKLAGLLEKNFAVSVHIPDYLERLRLHPGAEPVGRVDKDDTLRPIDWDDLFRKAGARVEVLQKHAEVFKNMRWEDQVELREKMQDLNSRLERFLPRQQ